MLVPSRMEPRPPVPEGMPGCGGAARPPAVADLAELLTPLRRWRADGRCVTRHWHVVRTSCKPVRPNTHLRSQGICGYGLCGRARMPLTATRRVDRRNMRTTVRSRRESRHVCARVCKHVHRHVYRPACGHVCAHEYRTVRRLASRHACRRGSRQERRRVHRHACK